MATPEWPCAVGSLFNSGEDWENEALLSMACGGFSFYAAAYKEVADSLVKEVESGILKPDLVGYPVIYLYHHYLELILKEIILSQPHFEESNREKLFREHKIDGLWARCKPVLDEYFPDGDRTGSETVDQCIKEFASIDNTGEQSKYPVLNECDPITGGRKLSFRNPVQLNLRNMREIMCRVDGLLSPSLDYLNDLRRYDPGREE